MEYSRRQIIRIVVHGSLLYSIAPLDILLAEPKYSETISAIRFLYGVEESVHQTYLAFADKARIEKYTGIANLFQALAMAEKIHAKNFKGLLAEFGINEPPELVISEVRSTKKNLKNAIDTELYHIEMVYPSSLEDIKDEKHDKIIQFVTYAWQSEMIHRDLLKEMKAGMGIFFKMMAGRIEKKAKRFYICPICGSTYEKIPIEQCPTCSNSTDDYILLIDGQLTNRHSSQNREIKVLFG